MLLDESSLGSFGDLATAIGLLGPDGQPNTAWFADPVAGGDPATGHGLKHVMADAAQRDALTRFVDQVLGPPDAQHEGGATWVPLFHEAEPNVTIYAVVEPVGNETRLGIGLEHTTSGGPPTVTSRLHVPVFRFAGRGATLDSGGGIPSWLLLGREGGAIEIGVDATFTATAPPPGEASLGGVGVTLTIPTGGTSPVAFAMTLRDLQLPGASAPQTFTLDAGSPDALGPSVLQLVAGLVRAQADALDTTVPALRPFAALAGMLGLRDVAGLPPFPLADLPTQGVRALVSWVEQVLGDNTARDAWLGQVASLVSGTLDADRDAVTITVGPVALTIGLRVETGTGGHPVLVPWVEVALDTRAGARVRAEVDLFRADTSTGSCTALPDVRLEAVFGKDKGTGTALVAGADPHVDSVHVGLALNADHQPVFVLTAHNVTLGGPTHDVIDLSSPQAALAAGEDLLTGAITTALHELGDPGDFIARILGIDPPDGVAAIDVAGLVSDPVAAVRTYWTHLLASSVATADVLGTVARLVAGAAEGAVLPGAGSRSSPWRIEMIGPLELQAWLDGTTLHLDLAVEVDVDVFGDYRSTTALRLALVMLDPTVPRVTFAGSATFSSALRRTDGAPARLGFSDLALVADELAVDLAWSPTTGLAAALRADGLAVELGGVDLSGDTTSVPIPLPTLDANGRLTLAAPDWDAVETALAALISRLGLPETHSLLELLGWSGGSAHLGLAGLLGPDPAGAVQAWLADLVLDCDHVADALGPISALLSGFSLTAPLGTGNSRDPFRCPVAGEPRAPGLRVWLDPGCVVRRGSVRLDVGALLTEEPPDTDHMAQVLRSCGTQLPDVADLMVGRDSLGEGLRLLIARWTGTDGLTGAAGTIPSDVASVSIDGRSYDELLALGGVGSLVPQVLDSVPTAIVNVGCEQSWLTDRPDATAFDLTGAPSAGSVPAAGPGMWFVRLPSPADAATARPDRGSVGEQAARLVALLTARTDPVVLVGYGAAGAAVVRAAAGLPAVTDVVTVGSPWGLTSVDALRSGLGGDALRLLGLLQRSGVDPWPDVLLASECTPLQRTRLLVARSSAALSAAAALPSAADEVRRAGLAVHAVFGDMDPDDLARGVAAFLADGLDARSPAPSDQPNVTATALHAAVDLPVFDLDVGGLLVGVGAAIEVATVTRADPGPGLDVRAVRSVIVDVHLGVHDGWLVGGPGATGSSADLRWMSARVVVPLDGSVGDCELVLHEARGLGVDRERWVVRADGDGVVATVAVPEVRVLLSEVVARLRSGSPDLATMLETFGLVRDDGLDPDGLDRLLHDTASTLRRLTSQAPAAVAAALRALVPTATGSGSAVAWALGPASIGLDLATGAVTAQLAATVEGLLPVALDLAASAGATHGQLTVGSIDTHLGGVRLVAATPATPGASASVEVEWAAANGAAARHVGIWPDLDGDGLVDLASVLLPALGIKGLAAAVLSTVSETARPLVEQALTALGLLTELSDGIPRLRLPLAVVQNPASWLVGVAHAGSVNPATAAVALLDALAPIVVPDRGATPGWPIADGVTVAYAAESDRLRISVAAEIAIDAGGGHTVTTHLLAGALIGLTAAPEPVAEIAVDVDGRGLSLDLDPNLRISLLRAAPAPPLPLYPEGPGLGQALEAVAESLLPAVLDEIASLGSGPAGIKKDVGLLVADVGDALQLRVAGSFDTGRITDFAANPAGVLLARLPALAASAVSSLTQALDPAGTLVRSTPGGPGVVTLAFGSAQSVSVTLDAAGGVPSIAVRAHWEIPDVGEVALEELRLSTAGVLVAARIGPIPVNVGPFSLRPLLVVRAGSAAGSDRLVSLGLALDDAALESVELRWGLDAHPPTLTAVTRDLSGATLSANENDAALWLLSIAVSLASGIVIDGLGDILSPRVIRMLRGVVFAEGATEPAIDPNFVPDLLEPERLLGRAERLLWNVATDAEPLSLTIDGLVTIGIAHDGDGTHEQLGINVSLPPHQRFTLADGDTKVELEVDASWLDPSVAPGLTIYAVSGVRTVGAPDTYAFSLAPGVTVAGLGVRFTKASGPLLSLGPISLDGIALHLYGEATVSGVGGGVQLELAGLAFAPAAGGGGNAVANSIMSDAGESSPASRPAFSPAIAVQKHPTDTGLKISLRAGEPPGPWWIVVQRQLGPLYLERVGLDTAESAGRITRITLLFDGRVEIFGLTAAVDQLSLSWLGGDPLDIHQWAVDLQGLAVSADMSGVVLAGGMLKTTDNGVVSYVGMLLGRFGIYGLSVFGGYSNDNGNASFFIFGAVNGPIGGPPAFFVTGLGGGLGINRKLVIPDDPALFPTYPFIQALDPYASVPEPMDELRMLNTYFGVERGSFWFAAGISFTCFSLVDGIAVLAVSFGDGLEINLMGLARLALPNPAAALVSIELGLLARFSTREGLFMIRAALTDNSWLLYSDVRLTGGFAFVVWWKGPLSGQFVLTIGGYHPDFHRDGYPDVPRVGLCWQVSDAIVIKGGGYFALTSEALMAGVGVQVIADFGWAWLRVTFGADGIVYFDPFWFDVRVYATISAGVKIDTWFGTISFGITAGAEIHVWGPDFAGEATVQVGPCSVTAPFGSRAQTEGIVQQWPGFVAKYLEDAGGGTARALSAITGRGSLPAATGGGRSAPPPDGSTDHPFEVFAEFEMTLTTTMPTANFDIGAASVIAMPVIRTDGSSAALGLSPMKASNLSSTLRLRLQRMNQQTHHLEDDPTDLAQLVANVAAGSPRPEGSRIATGSFPIGVWGAPDPVGTPQPQLPTGDVLVTGNQVTLVAEAASFHRGPEIDYYRVEAERRPLPLQATGSQRATILSAASRVSLPDASTVARALAAASTELFAAQPALVTGGPLERGDRSRLARACYSGDVAAPPLFGTLTDGLATGNGDNVLSASQAAPVPPSAPVVRTPRVLAFLTAGVPVAERTAGTTVADASRKRRPAPTLESVQARLGAHLPLNLDVALPPGDAVAKTFTPSAMPRTGVPGASRSYGPAEGPAANRVVGLTGFGGVVPKGLTAARKAGVAAAADVQGSTLASGDLVVLHAPDHSVDTDEQRRPLLRLDGSARVTMLRGDGLVLSDAVLTGETAVPTGTAVVAVQADGTTTVADGFPGWHSRSRVAALGTSTAVGAGCVLVTDGGLTTIPPGWTTAGDLVRDVAVVLTRFSGPVTAVVVVVESDDPDRVEGMGLELIGATRAVDAHGTQLEPALLVNGTQAIAVYPVVPDPAAPAVAVKVTAGGDWRLTGLLASTLTVAEVVSSLVRDGVVASTARMLAVAGPGATPTWVAAPARTTSRGGARRGRQ